MERIVVTPEELKVASGKLSEDAANYETISAQLMEAATVMGTAWTGEDNQAFVTQISGFNDDFKLMVTKLRSASEAIMTMATAYVAAQEGNVTAVKSLQN